MKPERLYLFFAAFFILLSSSALASQGLLKVTVTDCSNGQNIANAQVSVQSASTQYTDYTGTTYFTLSPGNYYVTASNSGYSTKSNYVYVYQDQVTTQSLCLNSAQCNIYATVSASAANTVITSTVTLTNNGGVGQYVSVQAYACQDTYCSIMYQSTSGSNVYYQVYGTSTNPNVYVPAYGSATITFTMQASVNNYNYRVKVTYTTCSNTNTIYSNYISVPTVCDQMTIGTFRCYGNYMQRQYQYSDCSTIWKDVEYCPYGCVNNFCLPKGLASLGEPVVILDKDYKARACEVSVLSFTVKNVGDYEGRFDIEISGPASPWIHVFSLVTIDKGERKTIIGYVSLPCDIKGDYQFTVKASDKTSDSDTTTLSVTGREEVVDTGRIILTVIGALIIAFAIAFIVILIIRFSRRFFVSKPKEETFEKQV